MGRPHWQSARTAILATTASLFQTNVILCQSWNTMLYFASFNYLTSPRSGREREKDCYLSRWLDCSRKCMWPYEKASWQQIKFSDEIPPDSLRKMFVTNKTGKSYYALLWVIHSCHKLCTNSDVCWTALWADSLHLPGKIHTQQISTQATQQALGPPQSQSYSARSMRKTQLLKYYSTFIREYYSNEQNNPFVSWRNSTMPKKTTRGCTGVYSLSNRTWTTCEMILFT